MNKYTVTNIEWDTDDWQVKLPKEIEIIVPTDIQNGEDIVEYISDEISNRTGYCHKGFATTPKIIYE
jgi:hypothetical protein